MVIIRRFCYVLGQLCSKNTKCGSEELGASGTKKWRELVRNRMCHSERSDGGKFGGVRPSNCNKRPRAQKSPAVWLSFLVPEAGLEPARL